MSRTMNNQDLEQQLKEHVTKLARLFKILCQPKAFRKAFRDTHKM
ncbi:hypothetical protein SAMN05660479_03371 [Microbulbifer thermotolerans]|nr:hypothetical protein SAMN05660479_03371 [Microbulbifer thermotolerans]